VRSRRSRSGHHRLVGARSVMAETMVPKDAPAIAWTRLCCEQNRVVHVKATSYDPEMVDLVLSARHKECSEPPAQAAPDRRKPREPLWRHMLGDSLRGLRHERGETLGEIASRAGLSLQYLSEIERGLKEPSSEMIAAVSGALDITLVDLTLDVAENLIATQRPSSPQVSARRSAFALAA
jgi:DNA-binding XRE family transcriptional regulator